MPTDSETRANIRSALRFTLSYAAGYSALLAGGALVTGGRSLGHFQRSLGVIIAVHIVGAVYVGVLARMFSKWATTTPRGIILGILISFPFCTGVGLVFRPSYGLDIALLAGAISATIMGGIIGEMSVYPTKWEL